MSKATAANALLRITHSGGDTLLDFTQAVNGKSWRDTFKASIAKALQGSANRDGPTAQEQPAHQPSSKTEKTQPATIEKLDAVDLFRIFQKYGPK